MRFTVLLFSIVLCCAGLVSNALSQPAEIGQVKPMPIKRVLVSIHPLALLVKSAWPNIEVQTLVKANQSPHDFSLKPSHMKQVHMADAIIWLGPEFEPYLKKVLGQSQNESKPQVDLASFDSHDDHSDHDGHEHEAHGDHINNQVSEPHNPHLWLLPTQLRPMLEKIAVKLSLPEPKRFYKLYDAWLTVARFQMNDKTKMGFVSYHDAFSGWVDYFALNQLAVVTNNPEKPVGTRHVLDVRKILASQKQACLLVEPQFQGRLLKKLQAGLDVRLVKIDPMASEFKVKDANFLDFYSQLLKQFSTCLKP